MRTTDFGRELREQLNAKQNKKLVQEQNDDLKHKK